MKLSIEDEIAVVVDPHNHYQDTGLQVTEGDQYIFEAQGLWADASRICGPEGWSDWWTPPLIHFSRVPNKNFFYLCGNINREECTNFPIGSYAKKVIDTNGRLYLFANDFWYLYCNNHMVTPEKGGPLIVKIRLAANPA